MSLSYSKRPLSATQQVNKLLSNGLIINDIGAAENFFEYNSYYRFSAYTFVFETSSVGTKRNHRLRPGTTFEEVKRLYMFDHKLRELTSHALRHIEVGIRTKICLVLATTHGSGHFYMNPQYFKKSRIHTEFLARCYTTAERSQETFIKHYKKEYATPELPPFWMMIEVLTFGQVSMFFENLTTVNQKAVSVTLDLAPDALTSWLAAMSYTRNLCAHHSRLWNRKFTKKPQGSKRLPITEPGSYAQAASVTKYLLDQMEPDFHFASRLKVLLDDYPEIVSEKLGFRQKKLSDTFWDS